MITHHALPWWIEKFQTPFSLARFGDGEFLCIEGREGRNSHGCDYTPALRKDLIEALKADELLKGMQRILPSQHARVRPLLTGEWVDTELFADLLAQGELKPFFDMLRTREFVIVSSADKRNFPITPSHFIETPATNTHAVKDDIMAQVLKHRRPCIYLFACGLSAGTLVHALHGLIEGATLIDIGHILDPFCGDSSREYLKHVDTETLNKNL